MKKTIVISGLVLLVISGCSLAAALSPEDASLFNEYNELTIGQIEPAYGTQIPQRYLSQLREAIISISTDRNLFQRINTPAESQEGESPVPRLQPVVQSENNPPANPPANTMILQIKVTSFKPVPSELDMTRSASPGVIGITCNFMDGSTGQLIDQADFGDVSNLNRGNITLETTELLIYRVGKDVVKYISQRKNLQPDKK